MPQANILLGRPGPEFNRSSRVSHMGLGRSEMFDRRPWMADQQVMDSRMERRPVPRGDVLLEVTGGESVLGRAGRDQAACAWDGA